MRVLPEGSPSAKLWIIGEVPGPTEVKENRPFCGGGGRVLDNLLKVAGIDRKTCYLDYVLQEKVSFRSMYVDARLMQPSDDLIKEYSRIKSMIIKHRPNVVVLLGNEALAAVFRHKGILKWRGSILNFSGVKVIPTLDPIAIMRQPELYAIGNIDFSRIVDQVSTPALPRVYKDNFILNPTFDQCMHYLKEVLPTKKLLTFDIETIPDKEDIMCMGFAWSKEDAICIPIFYGISSWWTQEEELELIKEMKKLFANPSIGFIAQNAQYDMTYIYDKWGIEVANLWMDTMIAFHCVYPEMKKSLAFLTSMYTNRPYYKEDGGQGKTPKQEWEYNCKDVCATYECAIAIQKELVEFNTWNFYKEHSHKLIKPLLKMQSRGTLVNVEKRAKVDAELEAKIIELQARLDTAIGHPLNVGSPKQMKEWLYEELGLPKKFTWGQKAGKKTKVLSANEEAIEEHYKATDNPVLKIILEIRGIRKLLSTYIRASLEPSGRMCCSYKITGTTTGRLSSRSSIYGRGTNMQNIPRLPVIRSMFIADPGMIMVNADLSQAEARIVAHLAEDERMQRLFTEGGDIHSRNAAMIFNIPLPKVTKEQRQLAKSLVHGANYGIAKNRFSKLIGSTPAKAQTLLNQYHNLYMGLKLWHLKVREQIGNTRIMTTPFGRKRMFFGRWSEDLVREAIAYVPQSTVGDLLNLGLIRCSSNLPPEWELLMQNHDAVLAQMPEWTPPEHIEKFFKHYFEIPFEVNGKMIKIPMDIKVGKNWGEMEKI